MAAVYVNNLVVNSGSNFSQSFTLEGSDTNSALDLTGYSVSAQMRKWAGSSNATSFNAYVDVPLTDGKIVLLLNSTQTAELKPGRYVYDVVIQNQSGIKNRVIEGMVLVTEGVTR